MNRRIDFLDGLRGVAILGVLIFHAYASAPEFLPFGNTYEVVPLRLGWVGVQLFFLISGFVILMTLENCKGPLEFAVRRWARLFPAMLAASIFILMFDTWVGLGPYGRRSIADALPGLLFISPALIHAATGIQLQSLDTPFWSLYVEVVFYVVFGTAYFFSGKRVALALIISLAAVSYSSNFVASLGYGGSMFDRLAKAMDWLGFNEFFWFASGALFYNYYVTKTPRLFLLALALAIVGVMTNGLFRFGIVDRIGLLSVVIIFALAIGFQTIQRLFSNRVFLFFGFISYPFYLIHNNILVGLEGELAKHLPNTLQVLSPLPPTILLVLGSWLIAQYVEPSLRRKIIEVARSHSV